MNYNTRFSPARELLSFLPRPLSPILRKVLNKNTKELPAFFSQALKPNCKDNQRKENETHAQKFIDEAMWAYPKCQQNN